MRNSMTGESKLGGVAEDEDAYLDDVEMGESDEMNFSMMS